MSRTAIACILCLLLAGCAAPTAPAGTSTQDPADSATTAPSANTTTPAGTTTAGTTTDAPTADPNATEETNHSGLSDVDIGVSGGTIPVDHERAFVRTVGLLGVNVPPPDVLVVQSPAEIQSDYGGVSSGGSGPDRRNFVGVMGIGKDDGGESSDGEDGDDGGEGDDNGGDDGGDGDGGEDGDGGDDSVSVAAYTPSPHSVFVNERMTVAGRESALERTLAHEYVHNVQFRQSAFRRVESELGLQYGYSRDRYLTYVSVLEGAAVFVADAYDDRYLAGDWSSITSDSRYRSASSGVQYSIARYYFGSRYFDARFDSSANVSAAYDDPPRTTEQLLHPDANHSARRMTPVDLSVFVHPGENQTEGRTNTNGELFTRIALASQLNESRAAAAAAGWSADSLVPVTPDEETGNRSFVWATRWDSPAEADEFASALDRYLSSRATRDATAGDERAGAWRDGSLTFRTVRVSDETVVLLAGEEPFVRNATVSGTNSSVSVSVTQS